MSGADDGIKVLSAKEAKDEGFLKDSYAFFGEKINENADLAFKGCIAHAEVERMANNRSRRQVTQSHVADAFETLYYKGLPKKKNWALSIFKVFLALVASVSGIFMGTYLVQDIKPWLLAIFAISFGASFIAHAFLEIGLRD